MPPQRGLAHVIVDRLDGERMSIEGVTKGLYLQVRRPNGAGFLVPAWMLDGAPGLPRRAARFHAERT